MACNIDRQAEILEFIEPHQQLELVDAIDRKHLSQLIEAMSADDRVDLLEHMDEERVEQILPLIAQAERDERRASDAHVKMRWLRHAASLTWRHVITSFSACAGSKAHHTGP